MAKCPSRGASDGRVVGNGQVVVEEGMFGDEHKAKSFERGQQEIDCRDLWRDEEAAKLFGVHFFLTAMGLGLGV
jgi:hypothetical protein